MDQLGAAESGRPRMSVEEQLERIRRHQQGALREKKKAGLSVLGGGGGGGQETAPSRSPSFTRETPPRSTQVAGPLTSTVGNLARGSTDNPAL